MFQHDIPLAPLTTFRIPASARLFATYSSVDELRTISFTPEFLENPVFHLGGGSNVLFRGDFDGLVLRSRIMGIKRYDKDDDTSFLIAGAGEEWTSLVDYAVGQGLAGLENLAAIPGTVGAAPVQNIGAYGAEVADVIHNVECFDCLTHNTVTLSNAECRFGYRDSIFKNEGKGRYVITRVSFRLKRSSEARSLHYGPLKHFAESIGHAPSIAEVAAEVTRIRNAKLPDPREIGSAGSYFKNPVVRIYFFREVMSTLCPDIPYYPTGDPNYVKIPAGWLIEHAGLKGFSVGGAEVYPRQCLVIANRGGATAEDVLAVQNHVVDTVLSTFGVTLRPEVNLVDTSVRLTFLGTGTSKGIPEIGCMCPVCRSKDPADNRLRCSALVETQGVRLLIDVSPDFRFQALRENITYLDAALITHNHYDHVGGFDDLRPFCALGKFPVFLRPDVNADLHRRIDYCFRDHLYPGVPSFDMHEIGDTPFLFKGVKIIPITVMHGQMPIVGFRIGSLAYVTDAKTIPDEEKEKLRDLDILVLNALRYKDHFAHLTVDEALALIEELKPRRAYLTHFCHEVGCHADLARRLLPNVFPAHDSLTIST